MARDTQVLGVSCDPRPSLAAYNVSLGPSTSYPVRLLSDFHPHGEMTRAYGLFNEELGASLRAVVIVDKSGIVRFARTYESVRLPGPTGQGMTESDLDVVDVLAEVDRIADEGESA
jgi:alkyl hydroperoxide reductase subunit AhpC